MSDDKVPDIDVAAKAFGYICMILIIIIGIFFNIAFTVSFVYLIYTLPFSTLNLFVAVSFIGHCIFSFVSRLIHAI